MERRADGAPEGGEDPHVDSSVADALAPHALLAPAIADTDDPMPIGRRQHWHGASDS